MRSTLDHCRDRSMVQRDGMEFQLLCGMAVQCPQHDSKGLRLTVASAFSSLWSCQDGHHWKTAMETHNKHRGPFLPPSCLGGGQLGTIKTLSLSLSPSHHGSKPGTMQLMELALAALFLEHSVCLGLVSIGQGGGLCTAPSNKERTCPPSQQVSSYVLCILLSKHSARIRPRAGQRTTNGCCGPNQGSFSFLSFICFR